MSSIRSEYHGRCVEIYKRYKTITSENHDILVTKIGRKIV